MVAAMGEQTAQITLNPEASKLNLPTSFLTELTEAIAGAVDVDSIYIFGSYARGEERPDSDIDICVVTKEPDDHFFGKNVGIRNAMHHAIWKMGLDYDLVSTDRETFDLHAEDLVYVYNDISEEGIMIYG